MTALRSLAAAVLAAGAFACLPPVAGAEHSLVSMVSTGPAVGPCPQPFSPPLEHLSCAPRFHAASTDGKRVFFSTAEPLVADDLNRGHDLYVREGGITQRITRDRGFGESNLDGLVKASRDGTRVLFHTRFAQVPEDNDFGGFDVYEWSDAGVRPLLPNPSATHSTLAGISQDAAQVFVLSSSKLVSEDTDQGVDLYAIEGAAIELVSTGPLDGARNVSCACNFAAVSDDGRRVFFTSGIGFTPDDTDSSTDLYERFDGHTELVSKGTLDPGEEGWFITSFRISPDGSHVYFTTPDRLLPEATPDPSCIDPFEEERYYPCIDLYERTGGVTRLVSGNGCTGCDVGLVGATSDGSVFFTTPESLSPGDTGGEDIYRDQAGEVTIAGTRPPGTFLFRERTVTNDGAHVFFKTRGSAGDEIWEHFGGETRKVTTGPLEGARCCSTALYPELLFVSEDGKRAFFATDERLVAEDPPDGSVDVYERHAGVTTLVSRRVDGAPFDFRLSGAAFSADGKRAYLGSRHPLVAEDTDQAVDLYEVAVQGPPDCSGARATTATLDKRRGFTVVGIEGVTDPEDDPVDVHIDGVTQDEPVRARGDPTTPDARLLGATAALRAERNPKGDGRVYHVAFTATDDHGGECSREALVAVPRHKHRPAVDSAPPAYDSLGG